MIDLEKRFEFKKFKSEHRDDKDIMCLLKYIETLELQILELEQKLNELKTNSIIILN